MGEIELSQIGGTPHSVWIGAFVNDDSKALNRESIDPYREGYKGQVQDDVPGDVVRCRIDHDPHGLIGQEDSKAD